MPSVDWSGGSAFGVCPACGSRGEQSIVLTSDSAVPGGPSIRLLACASCGVGFLADHAPLDYRAVDQVGPGMAVDYYVEQGAGVDAMAGLLLRLGPRPGVRLLEVGCGYGFALDFARSALGWSVEGVDPSPLAALGAAALGVPIHNGLLEADTPLSHTAFDCILASEILEHVEQPRPLLGVLRERLASSGVLVLTTPNFTAVRPTAPPGTLGRLLSPGFHCVLYTAAALGDVLRRAGFTAVSVEEGAQSLVAFAAHDASALARIVPAGQPIDRALLRRYFAAGAEAAPAGSALQCGFAYRHFKECVNGALYDDAQKSRDRLGRALRERHGIVLDTIDPAGATALARSARPPFNLTGALFFSGILRLNSSGDAARAAQEFGAAAAFAEALLGEQQRVGLCDGETEDLGWQSRRHVPIALAAVDGAACVASLEALTSAATTREAIVDVAATRLAAFVRLVNAGAWPEAGRLSSAIAASLAPVLRGEAEATRPRLDGLFALGVSALHAGRFAEARELFGHLVELAETVPGAADLSSWARSHQATARAGERDQDRGERSKERARPARAVGLAGAVRLLVGERFRAPCAAVSSVLVPLDVIAREARARLCFVVVGPSGVARSATVAGTGLTSADRVRLAFPAFPNAAGEELLLGAFAFGPDETPGRAALLAALRTAAAGRDPIVLECAGTGDAAAIPNLLLDDGGLSVVRVAAAARGLRTAHSIDAFWCDAHGVYVRGWVHAYEHRVTGLRLECDGRSVAVRRFAERADLLAFYPEHDHVRHAGFSAYLACPPARPFRAVVETAAGEATIEPLLPEGPRPLWNAAEAPADAISPRWRLFAELANAHGRPVLQIGARRRERAELSEMRLLRGPVIGLDIHPGIGVDIVADAHALGRTVRAGALGAVFSGAVLEHLQAPWLVAAEINRALALGGLVYHHAPMAWPAHAQPNDFWRFTDDGLSVLFGEASGFEILGRALLDPAIVVPTPSWRAGHLDMPTVPAYGGAEIVARKVRDLAVDEIAWPLGAERGVQRARRYPVEALRHGRGAS